MLVTLVTCLFLCCLAAAIMRSYSPQDLPNPMRGPREASQCGRPNVQKSAICDPDYLLTTESKNVIEGIINQIPPTSAQIAVAVIGSIAPTFTNWYSSKESLAKGFAKQLHDAWGVGNAYSNNGVVVFLSVEDKVWYVSTGEGIKGRLNSEVVDRAMDHAKEKLQTRDYGRALELIVQEIEMVLKKDSYHDEQQQQQQQRRSFTNPFNNRFSSYMSTPKAYEPMYDEFPRRSYASNGYSSADTYDSYYTPSDHRSTFRYWLSFLSPRYLLSFLRPRNILSFFNPQAWLLLLLGLVAGIVSLFKSLFSRNTRKGKRALDKLLTDVKDMQQGNRYQNDSCPICLESFGFSPFGGSRRQVMKLQCGHAFCKDCIVTHINSRGGDRCPICRQSVDAHLHDTYYHIGTRFLNWWRGKESNAADWPGAGGAGDNVELRYRLYRIRQMFPEVLSVDQYNTLNSMLLSESGSHVRSKDVMDKLLQQRESHYYRGEAGSTQRAGYGGGDTRHSGGTGGSWNEEPVSSNQGRQQVRPTEVRDKLQRDRESHYQRGENGSVQHEYGGGNSRNSGGSGGSWSEDPVRVRQEQVPVQSNDVKDKLQQQRESHYYRGEGGTVRREGEGGGNTRNSGGTGGSWNDENVRESNVRSNEVKEKLKDQRESHYYRGEGGSTRREGEDGGDSREGGGTGGSR